MSVYTQRGGSSAAISFSVNLYLFVTVAGATLQSPCLKSPPGSFKTELIVPVSP